MVSRFGITDDKVGLIGDPHLGKRIFGTNSDLVFDRFEEAVRFMNDKQPDFVIVLGDLFDDPKPTYGVIERFLKAISRTDPTITWYILEGNHDQFKNLELVSLFSHLKSCLGEGNRNIKLITEPTRIGKDKLLLPYLRAEELVLDGVKTVYAHFERYQVDDPIFKDAEKIYTGHEHKPSQEGKVTWVGSLTPLDRTQESSPELFKTVTLSELVSGKVTNSFCEVVLKDGEDLPEDFEKLCLGARIIRVEDDKSVVDAKHIFEDSVSKFYRRLEEKQLLGLFETIKSGAGA